MPNFEKGRILQKIRDTLESFFHCLGDDFKSTN